MNIRPFLHSNEARVENLERLAQSMTCLPDRPACQCDARRQRCFCDAEWRALVVRAIERCLTVDRLRATKRRSWSDDMARSRRA